MYPTEFEPANFRTLQGIGTEKEEEEVPLRIQKVRVNR